MAKRISRANPFRQRKPKPSEIRAAQKLAKEVSKFLADLLNSHSK